MDHRFPIASFPARQTRGGLFLRMGISNLIRSPSRNNDSNAELWKYVDDTTTSEIVFKAKHSNSQLIADKVVDWSSYNRVQLNSKKCKELRTSFAKRENDFRPITVNGINLECVTSAKLRVVTI